MLNRIAALIHDNGPVLAFLLLIVELRTRASSVFWSWVLGAQRARVGARANIRGGRHIHVGPDFSCQRDIWLEAVTCYRGKVYQPQIIIGSRVSCSDRVHISAVGSLTIGDDVLIGSGVYIGDHNHGRYSGGPSFDAVQAPAARDLVYKGGLSIGCRVFLADNVVVVGGLSIGDGAVVSANSVVTRSVPAYCLAAGAPARVIRRFDADSNLWIPCD